MGEIPPGPRLPAPVVTALLQRDPLGILRRAANRHGETFTLPLLPPGRVVVTTSPALVEWMLTGDPAVLRAGAATRCLLPLLGESSLIVSDGDAHRRRRQAMLPAFGPQGLEPWRPAIRRLAAEHVGRWPYGRPFALLPRARELAFDAVATVVGLRPGGLRDEVEARLSRLAASPVGPAIWLTALRRRAGGLGPWASFERRAHTVDSLLRNCLTPRDGRDEPPAVVDRLLDLRRDGVIAGERELLEELRTLLLVGHETASAAIAWTLLTVSRHPAILGQLDDERFAQAVAQEALRLHPPVIDVVRQLARPMAIAGYRLPRGTMLMAVPPLVHRRPDLYDAPGTFRPERFRDERPDPFAWIPFGGGRRRCLGASLATLELDAVLRAVATAGRLRPAETGQERARLYGTTIVPAAGGRVILDR